MSSFTECINTYHVQTVLYALAEKFLNEAELGEVKEVLAMTRLGQMLMEDGMKRGLERGIERGIALTKKVMRLYQNGVPVNEIADTCGIDKREVEKILSEDEE